jgi:hypothetical protein
MTRELAAINPSWSTKEIADAALATWKALSEEEKQRELQKAWETIPDEDKAEPDSEEETAPDATAAEEVKIVSRPAFTPKPPKAARKADEMDEEPVTEASAPAKRAKKLPAWMKGKPGDEAKDPWTLIREHVEAQCGEEADGEHYEMKGGRLRKPYTAVKDVINSIGNALDQDVRAFKETLKQFVPECALWAAGPARGADEVAEGVKAALHAFADGLEDRIYYRAKVEEVLDACLEDVTKEEDE